MRGDGGSWECVRGESSVNGGKRLLWFVLVGLFALGVSVSAMGIVAAGGGSPSATSPTLDGQPGESPSDTTLHSSGTLSAGGHGEVVSELSHSPAYAIVLLATYSKYNDISPLEHDIRADIHAIIGAAPGLYFAQLVAWADRPTSTIRYHTKILEREGEIERTSLLGHVRLFPAAIPSAAFAYIAATRDPATARLIGAIERADEPVSSSELADAVDRAPSTVSYHLSRLEDVSVIERERNGESVHISIASHLDDLEVTAPVQRPLAMPKP